MSKNRRNYKKLLTAAIFIIAILAVGVTFLIPEKPELNLQSDATRAEIRDFWNAYNRATSFRSQKNFEAAIQFYERALEMNPAHEESLYYLAGSLLEIGEDKRALETYETILKQNPRSTRALSQLGILLSTDSPGLRADPLRAKEMFRQVLRVNQEESGPYLRLGLLAMEQGEPDDGFEHFQTAAGFKSPEGIFFCGYVRYRQRKYREAIDFFTKVLEINEHEKKISGRGVFSEGDVVNDSETALTPLEKAGLKALVYLYWSAAKLGSFPASVPEQFRLRFPLKPARQEFELMAESDGPKTVLPNGLSVSGTVLQVVQADYDEDGADDVLILRWKRPLIVFRNEGFQKFRDVTGSLNLKNLGRNSLAALFADYDHDNFLDLLVTENASYEDALQCLVQPEIRFKHGIPRLFRNLNGSGFQEVTKQVGLHHAYGTIKASALDVNQDNWMDFILANGGPELWRLEPSIVLINEKGKSFRTVPVPSLAEPGNARDIE